MPAACAAFRSGSKFESGTGWPSFTEPFDPAHVSEIRDTSHGMVRIEERCARCDTHLGHVFPDGRPPNHQRYCLNSVSLEARKSTSLNSNHKCASRMPSSACEKQQY